MGKISLQLQANLENVSSFSTDGEDFRWYLKLKCNNCGDISSNWQYVTESEKSALKGSRGEANLVTKCKLCQRENSIDVVAKSVAAYVAKDVCDFQTVITFDCRGLEPVDFSPRVGWKVKSADSSTVFSEVSLAEKEWVDYDEKAAVSVGIYDLQHQFVKS